MMRIVTYVMQRGVLCHCVITKLVISRFPVKSRRFTETMDVGHEAIKTEKKAWTPCAPGVVCQRHFTDSDYRPIKPFGE